MIFFGTRLFGRVDRVPGVGYVATSFFHINFIPIIPRGGWLVFQESGKTWKGVRILPSRKSIIVAWARIFFLFLIALGSCLTLIVATDRHPDPVALAVGISFIVVGLGSTLFSYLHPGLSKASYVRAMSLAQTARLDANQLAELAKVYGKELAPLVPPSTNKPPLTPIPRPSMNRQR